MIDSTTTPQISPSKRLYDIKHSIESTGWFERLRDNFINTIYQLTIKIG